MQLEANNSCVYKLGTERNFGIVWRPERWRVSRFKDEFERLGILVSELKDSGKEAQLSCCPLFLLFMSLMEWLLPPQ